MPVPPRPTATITRAPRLLSFDRRRQRQLATGRVAIDARIDLHGMTQSEAHATLRAFLYACSARGDRMVLVITGKGAPAAHLDAIGFDGEPRERGVLRRNVPRWLAEPDLEPLVVACGPASARHGGDGALYVQLRVRRADRGPDDDFD
jgi:DNA-nicking Smr family endonuclease